MCNQVPLYSIIITQTYFTYVFNVHTYTSLLMLYIVTIMVAKEMTLIESLCYRMALPFTFEGHTKLYIKGTIEFGK